MDITILKQIIVDIQPMLCALEIELKRIEEIIPELFETPVNELGISVKLQIANGIIKLQK